MYPERAPYNKPSFQAKVDDTYVAVALVELQVVDVELPFVTVAGWNTK
jgi:hypothetical protein